MLYRKNRTNRNRKNRRENVPAGNAPANMTITTGGRRRRATRKAKKGKKGSRKH